MSAPRLDTKVDLSSDEARARAAHNRALAEKLRKDVAKAARGGNEKSRERHLARGKLLPRDRVERKHIQIIDRDALEAVVAGQPNHRDQQQAPN
jgi:acetyl-CoA carboxylase carboxyltransferase component